MALIQIRDVPEDAYEIIRSRARANGQSIQAFMLARTIEVAARPDLDALRRQATALGNRYPDLTRRAVIEALDAVRQE